LTPEAIVALLLHCHFKCKSY